MKDPTMSSLLGLAGVLKGVHFGIVAAVYRSDSRLTPGTTSAEAWGGPKRWPWSMFSQVEPRKRRSTVSCCVQADGTGG